MSNAHVRSEGLEHLLLLLASHAEAWPELWETSPSLLGYLARQGAWHLARVGRVPEAVAFLDRLLAFEGRAWLLTLEQTATAQEAALVALSFCPTERRDDVDGPALVRLLLSVQNRTLLRPGCALLAQRDLDVIGAAFADDPNPSAAAAYVLAEELAQRVIASEDEAGWRQLAEIAADHDHAIQYTALYAFKYIATERPRWLTTEVLRPFATGGPFDRLAVTTLLLFLALQGDPFPSQFDLAEFWEPKWAYNTEEIELLHGAMAFRDLCPGAGRPADLGQRAEMYHTIERRRQETLQRLETDDSHLRSLLESYWHLTTRLDDLGRLPTTLREHACAPDIIWLLMVSPFWEVSEDGSALLARFAARDEAWGKIALAWAVGDDQTTWWGALVALRLLAERTGRDDALFEAVRVQCAKGSAQLRGNCANTLHTLVLAATSQRREELLHAFSEEFRMLLHDEDVWAVNEILLLLEGLEDQRELWAQRWDADHAPLLRHTPDWRDITASEWGDVVHTRLYGGESEGG